MKPLKFDHYVVLENGRVLAFGSKKKDVMRKATEAIGSTHLMRLPGLSASQNKGEIHIKRCTKRFCRDLKATMKEAGEFNFVWHGDGGVTHTEMMATMGHTGSVLTLNQEEAAEDAAREAKQLSKFIQPVQEERRRSSWL